MKLSEALREVPLAYFISLNRFENIEIFSITLLALFAYFIAEVFIGSNERGKWEQTKMAFSSVFELSGEKKKKCEDKKLLIERLRA